MMELHQLMVTYQGEDLKDEKNVKSKINVVGNGRYDATLSCMWWQQRSSK